MKWWVYVLKSIKGPHYVGCTTCPQRRIRQHNGEIRGGAKSTARSRPWRMVMIYGPYPNRSEAQKAEYALKHSKRGEARTRWNAADSDRCVTSDEAASLLREFEEKLS